MIAGQSPRLQWQPNHQGQTRALEQAIEIARTNGVDIADDLDFFLDELGELHADFTACGPRVDKLAGSIVHWSDLVHDRTGKVSFRIWPGILKSDEAIVAVLANEVYEIEQLRGILNEGKTTIEAFIGLTCPGNPGNLHDEAWVVADRVVERMRKEPPHD